MLEQPGNLYTLQWIGNSLIIVWVIIPYLVFNILIPLSPMHLSQVKPSDAMTQELSLQFCQKKQVNSIVSLPTQ